MSGLLQNIMDKSTAKKALRDEKMYTYFILALLRSGILTEHEREIVIQQYIEHTLDQSSRHSLNYVWSKL